MSPDDAAAKRRPAHRKPREPGNLARYRHADVTGDAMSTLMFAKIAAERAEAAKAAKAQRERRIAAQNAAQRRLQGQGQPLPPLRTGLPLAAGDLPATQTPATTQDGQADGDDEASDQQGVGQYVEALAGLIPAEVLTLHALTLTVTTSILSPTSTVGKAAHEAIAKATSNGAVEQAAAASAAITTITAPETLKAAFYGLVALSVVLYLVPRGYSVWKAADPPVKPRRWWREMRFTDWVSCAIPPLSFVAWTMLQRTTAFDAAFPHVAEADRTVLGLFLAVVLLAVSGWIAFKPVTADDSDDTDHTADDDADDNTGGGAGDDEDETPTGATPPAG